MSSKQTGEVRWYVENLKYGFIIPDVPMPDGKDLFMHKKNIIGDVIPQKKQRVEFTLGTGRDGGFAATDVVVLDEVVA